MFENISHHALQQYWWIIISVLGALFVDLYHGMQPTRSAGRDGDIRAPAHLVDGRPYGRLFGHTHQQFVL